MNKPHIHNQKSKIKNLKLIVLVFAFILTNIICANAQLPTLAPLIESLQPSVVNISTIAKETGDDNEELFDARKTEALGSGFIIDEAGFIVTNNHVISGAEDIEVILFDNTRVPAKLIGHDKKTDLALIKIEAQKKLSPVKFGDSNAAKVGDWVVAIGNPFGLGSSASVGIISAKERDIESGPYDSFLQTDASINEGSSGGPMFNLNGEVIGVNTVMFSNNGVNMGVGFAIPSDMVKWVVPQLKVSSKVVRGWAGLKVQSISEDLAKSLKLPGTQGVLVSGLTENSPATRADLSVGDVILNFDGKALNNPRQFSKIVAETAVGKQSRLDVWRDGQKINILIGIEEAPEIETKKPADEKPSKEGIGDLGFKAEEITPMLRDKYQLNNEIKGLIITEVAPLSEADVKGLKVGDVIVKVDKKDVFDKTGLNDFVNEARFDNNRPILLLVQHGDALNFVALKLRQP